jgi:hypothetical protein
VNQALEKLVPLIRAAWSADTSANPEEWSKDNPALGQCAVTALYVQEVFGGTLQRVAVFGGGSHYYNRIDGYGDVDLTRQQFPDAQQFGPPEERTRAYVLSFPVTMIRYRLLRSRLHREPDL